MLSALDVLLDGLAYGNLLFLTSIGLSVTIGLMNPINLVHRVFTMAGGYICVVLMDRLGVPFSATLPIAFVVTAIIGLALRYTLCQQFYRMGPLDQVLFSIVLVFAAMAGAIYVQGPSQQPVELPEMLRG